MGSETAAILRAHAEADQFGDASEADAIALIEAGDLAADALVIGPGATEPAGLARRAGAADPRMPVIILCSADRHTAVLRALQILPSRSSDVRCLSVAEGTEALLAQIKDAGARAKMQPQSVTEPREDRAFGRLLDRAPIAVVTVDAAGVVGAWSRGAALLFGLTERDALGRSLPELFSDPEPVRRLLSRCFTTGEAREPLLERDHGDGPQHTAALAVADGPPQRATTATVLLFDVSDRLRAERERDRAASRVRDIEAVTELALSGLGLAELLPRLLNQVQRSLDVDVAAIFLPSADGSHVEARAAVGIPGEMEETRLPVGEGIAGRVALSRSPMIVDDTSHAPMLLAAFRNAARSILAVPLTVEGAAGAVLVGSARPRRFTAEDVGLLQFVADRVAVTVDHAHAYEAERAARAEAEAARLRLELLADANSLLVATLDSATVLRRLADLVVPALADWCSIDVLDDDGTLRRETVSHGDPAKRDVAARLKELPPDPEGTHPALEVLQTGRPYFRPQLTDEDLRGASRTPEHLEIMRSLGHHSAIIVPLAARGGPFGALTMVLAETGRWYTEDDLSLAEGLGRRAGLAIENARLFEAERRARNQAERTQERLALLAEAGELLAGTLDVDETLERLSRLIVSTIADGCAIDIVGDRGTRRIAITHRDPAQERLAREVFSRFPFDPDAPRGAARVIRTGAPELYREVPEAVLAEAARDETHLEMIRRFDIRSGMVVPLRARGRVLGAITMVASGPSRRYSEDDLSFAQEVARRAAIAVDTARLFEAEREAHAEAERARRRLQFLSEASRLLGASLDYRTVLERFTQLAVPELGDWCSIELIDEKGRLKRLAVAHADPDKRALADELARHSPALDNPNHPASRAVREGRTIVLPEITESFLRASTNDAEHLEAVRRLDPHSAIAVPLSARGRVLGAMTLSWNRPRLHTPDEINLAEELARRGAIAVDNANLFRAVERAERRVHALIHGVDAIVWEADPLTGRLLFVSRKAEELLGYPAAHWFEDRTRMDIVHPDDRERLRRARSEAFRAGRDHDIEFRVIAADGRVLWVRDVVHLTADEQGRPRMYGVAVDVTDRKNAERRRQAQQEINRVLAEETSLAAAARKILEQICGTLDWNWGAYWEVDPHVDRLRLVCLWQRQGRESEAFAGVSRATLFPRGVGLPGRVWESSRPAWIPDVARDRNFPRAPVAAREGLHGAFAFPVLVGDQVGGVMEFFSADIREPDEELLALLGSVGSQIGQFAERCRIEAELRYHTTLLQSESEATLDGVLVVGPDARILSFNRRFVEMWQIPEQVIDSGSDDEALQSVLHRLADPDEFLRRVEYLYAHPGEQSQDEVLLRDGRIFDRYSTPLRGEDGTYYGRAWYFRDITVRRRAEEEARKSQERAAFLADASSMLSASLDHQTTLAGLARLTVPFLADACLVDVGEDGRLVHRLAVAHRDPAAAAAVQERGGMEVSPPADPIVASAFASGSLQSAEGETAAAGVLGTFPDGDVAAVVCAPLVVRDRALGALTFVNGRDRGGFSASEVGLAEELARRAAFAVENARLYRDRAHVARTLQESLLPPHLPEIPGVELAARYLAAGEGNEVGGDFYDVFHTGGRGWGVVLGDVCGKGADAAAVTALARYTIRAAAMQLRRPRRILQTLNEAMLRQRSDQRFCTVAYARLVLVPGGIQMVVSCGGHPSPLILRADGRVESVGHSGTLLGVFPDPQLIDEPARLGPGDAILLYTDGVTEARGAGGVFGEQALEALLRSCRGLSSSEIAEKVEAAVLGFGGGETHDDIALVVVKVPEDSA